MTHQGHVLVMRSCDVRLSDAAKRGHFKTIQLPNGNFAARLPLEKRLLRLTYGSRAILHKNSRGQYVVMKDFGGRFSEGRMTPKRARELFGPTWVEWKFPRKIKKQYKHFADIAYAKGYNLY